MQTYRTAQLAALGGVHPNTVRYYEAEGLLPPAKRQPNGYRVYTRRHLSQLRLVRLALRAEILSDDLRAEAVQMLKVAAAGRRARAKKLAALYAAHLEKELKRARHAAALAASWLSPGEAGKAPNALAVQGRRAAAQAAGVSVHVLRGWERNGLLPLPQGRNKHYSQREMDRIAVIGLLRSAHYSQMAIRRMLHLLDEGKTGVAEALDTPAKEEDVVSVADRYITSLCGAVRDARAAQHLLEQPAE